MNRAETEYHRLNVSDSVVIIGEGPHAPEIEVETDSRLAAIAIFSWDEFDIVREGFHPNDPAGIRRGSGMLLQEVWLAEPIQSSRLHEALNALARRDRYVDGGIEQTYYILAEGQWHKLLWDISPHLTESQWAELQRLAYV